MIFSNSTQPRSPQRSDCSILSNSCLFDIFQSSVPQTSSLASLPSAASLGVRVPSNVGLPTKMTNAGDLRPGQSSQLAIGQGTYLSKMELKVKWGAIGMRGVLYLVTEVSYFYRLPLTTNCKWANKNSKFLWHMLVSSITNIIISHIICELTWFGLRKRGRVDKGFLFFTLRLSLSLDRPPVSQSSDAFCVGFFHQICYFICTMCLFQDFFNQAVHPHCLFDQTRSVLFPL